MTSALSTEHLCLGHIFFLKMRFKASSYFDCMVISVLLRYIWVFDITIRFLRMRVLVDCGFVACFRG